MDLLTATAGLGLGLGLVFHTLQKKDKTGREPWDPSKDTAEYDSIIPGGKKKKKWILSRRTTFLLSIE